MTMQRSFDRCGSRRNRLRSPRNSGTNAASVSASIVGPMATVISGVRIKVGTTHGDVRVTSGGKLVVVGIIVGTLTVESGGYAYIIGMIGGLAIEPGGRAKLPGLCTGDATNQGGDLEVRGTVNGTLHGQSITRVLPGARISPRKLYPFPFNR